MDPLTFGSIVLGSLTVIAIVIAVVLWAVDERAYQRGFKASEIAWTKEANERLANENERKGQAINELSKSINETVDAADHVGNLALEWLSNTEEGGDDEQPPDEPSDSSAV